MFICYPHPSGLAEIRAAAHGTWLHLDHADRGETTPLANYIKLITLLSPPRHYEASAASNVSDLTRHRSRPFHYLDENRSIFLPRDRFACIDRGKQSPGVAVDENMYARSDEAKQLFASKNSLLNAGRIGLFPLCSVRV